MSLISLVVPVYKVEPYLDRCVQSLLNQTFADFELILVDDGSPDRCGELCDSYAEKDARIHAIHQENGGLSAARNTGIDWVLRHSDSEWIGFIDSDDWVHPQYLQKLYQAAKDAQVNVSICGFCRTEKEEDYILTEECLSEITTPEDFWVKDRVNATVAWGKLYKKQCFLQERYPVGKLHEDEYVTYKVLFAEKNIAVIEEPLYCYFQNQSGIMNSAWTPRRIDRTKAIKEQLTFFLKHHYEQAGLKTAEFFLFDLMEMRFCLEQTAPSDPNEKWLQKELRIGMKKYCSKLNLSAEVQRSMYKMAYPKRFRLHHSIQKKKKNLIMLWKEKGVWGLWKKLWRKK